MDVKRWIGLAGSGMRTTARLEEAAGQPETPVRSPRIAVTDTTRSRTGGGHSRLVNRNVSAHGGRTSMRLEPELWSALAEICERERITTAELVRRIESRAVVGSRTSAVRVYIVQYFRAASTPEGHMAVGHGAGGGRLP